MRAVAELLFTRRHGYCVSLADRLPREDPLLCQTGRSLKQTSSPTGLTAGRAVLSGEQPRSAGVTTECRSVVKRQRFDWFISVFTM